MMVPFSKLISSSMRAVKSAVVSASRSPKWLSSSLLPMVSVFSDILAWSSYSPLGLGALTIVFVLLMRSSLAEDLIDDDTGLYSGVIGWLGWFACLLRSVFTFSKPRISDHVKSLAISGRFGLKLQLGLSHVDVGRLALISWFITPMSR